MDSKREAFLARLRESFRVEAAEHLEAINAGLAAMELAGDAERGALVERVFRESHSLKGAARSVGFMGVEAICHELESIFAVMKRGDLQVTTDLLDGLQPALRALAVSCAGTEVALASQRTEEERQGLAALSRLLQGPGHEPAPSTADVAPSTPPGASPSPPSASPRPSAPGAAAQPAVSGPAPDTIRVAAQKLNAILLDAQELVGARIAASGRAAELRRLAVDLAAWNRRRGRLASGTRRGGDDGVAASELVEAQVLHARSLETSLREVASAVQKDALSLAALVDRLLDDTRTVLLLPCSFLLGSLPALLRELAREHGKDADLQVRGEDIEIDRRVLDELRDPLLHLLRNCVDHGIETPDARQALGKPARGVVSITVTPLEGSRVELTMADDGAGIDARKVGEAAARLGLLSADGAAALSDAEVNALVFRSGVSTSPILTDLSGRGLGLAIVREKVEKLGGTIAVASTPHAGTTFRLVVPSSLATFRGVFVEVAGRPFVIPTANVVRVGRVAAAEIRTVENRQTVALAGQPVSLAHLREVLELSGPDGRAKGATRPVVVVRAGGRDVAFLVDEVLAEQEVMVRGLGSQLTRVRNVAGASLSGTGAVVPILNAADLVETACKAGAPAKTEAVGDASPERRARLLVAEDSITARTLVKSILEGAGYEVVASVDGLDALTRLKTEPFDLLVSDVDMPRMNGFELTAKVRADRSFGDLPVVLVTALASQSDREYGIEVGANAYIVKSDFDQGNLLEIIRRLL